MILLSCCDKQLLFPETLLLCLLLSWVKTSLSRNTQTTLSVGFSSNWLFKSCSCFVKRYKYISSFQRFTKLFSVLQSGYSQSTKLQILILMIMITYQTFPKWTKSFLDWAFQEWFKSSSGIWIFGKCTGRVTKSKNFLDSKIFVAKTFRIKRVIRVDFQIRDKCAQKVVLQDIVHKHGPNMLSRSYRHSSRSSKLSLYYPDIFLN